MKKRTIIAGAAAGAVVVGIAVASSGSDTPGHKTVIERAITSSSAPEAPEGPATSFSDGTFLVGTDIEAGTYKSPGDDTGIGCYWERAKDDSGDFDSIITNEAFDGPGRVTVKTGEIFKTSGDCEWRLVR